MEQEKVREAISKDRAAFNNALYKGKLPKDFVLYFQRAIFSVAPTSDNISTEYLSKWLSKTNKELTFGEVSKMVGVISSVARDKVFQTMAECLSVLPLIEQIHKDCSEKYNANEKRLERKRDALTNMGGQMKKDKVLKKA